MTESGKTELDGHERQRSGLDPRQVEHAAENFQERLGASPDDMDFPLHAPDRSLSWSEHLGHADDAVKGVRISWLMFARNVLFARLAASAASFERTSSSAIRFRSIA